LSRIFSDRVDGSSIMCFLEWTHSRLRPMLNGCGGGHRGAVGESANASIQHNKRA
jgi:hypothetical protein